jgi:uncharacterized RDD family membrane protein YckC
MKGREKEGPGLETGDPAREIDEILGDNADDPLDRVLLHHPPALFPEGEPARRFNVNTPDAEPNSLFPDETITVDEPAAPGLVAAATGARLRAFLADAALCGIVGGASFLSAAALVRRAPALRGWIWCAGFGVLLSFFLVVPTLALFGKTPGMALADLSAEEGGEKPPFAASIRRWAATVATVFLAGLPLISVIVDKRRRTPADLYSGRTLHPDPETAG